MLTMLRTNRDIRTLFIAQVVSYMGDWFCYGRADRPGQRPDRVQPRSSPWSSSARPSPASWSRPSQAPRPTASTAAASSSPSPASRPSPRFVLLGVGPGRVWLAFLAQGTIAAFGAFVVPASQAAVPNLARDDDELKKATALFGSTWGAMLAIGAAIGGAFAALFGRDAAFVADAASFVLAAVLVFTIRRPMQAVRDAAEARRPLRPIADMKEGLHHAKEDPVLLALLSSKATFGLGAGTVSILAVLVTDDFAGGDGATGLMLAMRGIGVGLGPIIAARLIGPSLSRLLRLCAAWPGWSSARATSASASPRRLAIAALFVLLAHLGGGAQWTMSTYGLQVRAPDEIRGRILAADFAFVTLILSVTTTAAGGLASIVGPRPTIATFALLGVLAGTTYLLLTRHLRRQLAQDEAAAAAAAATAAAVGPVPEPGAAGPDGAGASAVSRPGPP